MRRWLSHPVVGAANPVSFSALFFELRSQNRMAWIDQNNPAICQRIIAAAFNLDVMMKMDRLAFQR
jgi:hypothetical protein